jgi:hypothetical protein
MFLYIIIPSIIFILVDNFFNMNILLIFKSLMKLSMNLKFPMIALEGLAAVVNRVTCSASVPGSTLYVHACHPRGALPAPGLAGCPVGRGE